MPTIFKRKVLKVGGSLGLTIPDSIVKTYDLKRGDEISVVSDGLDEDGLLVIDIKGRTNEELWKIIRE